MSRQIAALIALVACIPLDAAPSFATWEEVASFMAAVTDQPPIAGGSRECESWCGEPGDVQFVFRTPVVPGVESTTLVANTLNAFGRVKPLEGPLGRRGWSTWKVPVQRLSDPVLRGRFATLLRNRLLTDLELDGRLSPATPPIPDDKYFPDQVSLNGGTDDLDLDAPEAWETFGSFEDLAGKTVGIGLVDTGIDDSCDWDGKLTCDLEGQICARNRQTFDTPDDDAGHGTMMASIIAAKTNNGKLGIAGVMSGARIYACKIALSLGYACDSTIAACMADIAAQSADCPPIAAINVSWEGQRRSSLIEEQIRELRKKGILIVAAAGNRSASNDNSDACPSYPASYPLSNVIAVGAADYAGAIKTNYGKRTVHLAVVQGGGVPTIRPRPDAAPDLFKVPNVSSSVAAAQISGLIALVQAKFPNDKWVALRGKVLAGGVQMSALDDYTITGRRARAWDTDHRGALTCEHQVVRRRLAPAVDTVVVKLAPGVSPTPIEMRALSMECGTPVAPIPIEITDGDGNVLPPPTFNDVGTAPDDYPEDGEWGAYWTPPATPQKTYVIRFWKPPGIELGDELTVSVE